jgi:hypothetical protein
MERLERGQVAPPPPQSAIKVPAANLGRSRAGHPWVLRAVSQEVLGGVTRRDQESLIGVAWALKAVSVHTVHTAALAQ